MIVLNTTLFERITGRYSLEDSFVPEIKFYSCVHGNGTLEDVVSKMARVFSILFQ